MKVLDFGLAKAVPRATAHAEESATIAAASVTMSGLILGTAAYMAPEQAKGNSADRRVDNLGAGIELFEMLTGRLAFAGPVPDVLVSIIEHEPDWQALPARTPPAIHRLLHRCLEKDFKRRLDSAAVARIEIEEVSGNYGGRAVSIGAISTASIHSLLWAPKAVATFSSLKMAVLSAMPKRPGSPRASPACCIGPPRQPNDASLRRPSSVRHA